MMQTLKPKINKLYEPTPNQWFMLFEFGVKLESPKRFQELISIDFRNNVVVSRKSEKIRFKGISEEQFLYLANTTTIKNVKPIKESERV